MTCSRFSHTLHSLLQTVSEVGLKDGQFLVVMVSKAAAKPPTPAAPASAPTTSSPAAPPPPASTTATAGTPAAPPAPSNVVSTTPDAGSSVNYGAAASTLVAGDQFEEMVTNLMVMGFDRDPVVRALQAAYNNPDRAVEYLMNGIPAAPAAPPPPAAAAPPAAAGGATPAPPAPPVDPAVAAAAAGLVSGGGAPGAAAAAAAAAAGGAADGAEGGPLDFLRQHPQFPMLRAMLQQNPQMITQLLQQVGQANPALLQAISQHPEEFMRLLAEGGGEGEEGAPPPGVTYIQVNDEERAALERLAEPGYPRQRVLEAFLACDRNEALAANYLIDHGFEEDEEDLPPAAGGGGGAGGDAGGEKS